MSEEDLEAVHRHASLDSETLLHHASETLLRLFLAHRGQPRCPWLELSRLRSFVLFKRLVRERFIDQTDADVDEVRALFVGAERHVVQVDDATWEQAPRNVEALLRVLSREILDGASLYNASKHGLAVRAGPSTFRLGDAQAPILAADGPAITFLETVESDGAQRWARAVEWVDVSRNLALVEMACHALDALWRVAKWRYCNEPLGAIAWFENVRVDEVMQPATTFTAERMSMDLAYFVDSDHTALVPRNIRLVGVSADVVPDA